MSDLLAQMAQTARECEDARMVRPTDKLHAQAKSARTREAKRIAKERGLTVEQYLDTLASL